MLIGVYGAGGHGREVMSLARAQLSESGKAVFVDDRAPLGVLNGHHVMRWADFIEDCDPEKYISIAVANSLIREYLRDKCVQAGVAFASLRASNVIVMDQTTIGEGAILSPFVTITSNVRVGRQFHANMYSYIAHDCMIGNYVTFAPAVRCNGNVLIEDHAYIGTGAVLRQGQPGNPLVIGQGAVIGMGAVVTRNVPPGVTVVGNPARPLVKE